MRAASQLDKDLFMEVDYDVIKIPRNSQKGPASPSGNAKGERGEAHELSFIGQMWESFRDLCYIIQDSKTFQHITTAMILCNAVVLAIVW